jgi:hypothetical protein
MSALDQQYAAILDDDCAYAYERGIRIFAFHNGLACAKLHCGGGTILSLSSLF